jgi:hypothetical protein
MRGYAVNMAAGRVTGLWQKCPTRVRLTMADMMPLPRSGVRRLDFAYERVRGCQRDHNQNGTRGFSDAVFARGQGGAPGKFGRTLAEYGGRSQLAPNHRG